MNAFVLVVDDEADMEALSRRDLKAGRFELAFVASAQGALRIIEEEGGRNIMLLLFDINIPSTVGLDLLPRAKAARPELPVIMPTAYGDAETRSHALQDGADSLLPKSINFAALRANLDQRILQWRLGT